MTGSLHYFGAALGLGLIVIGAALGIGRFASAAAESIARLIQAPAAPVSIDLDKALAWFEKERGIHLAHQQREA